MSFIKWLASMFVREYHWYSIKLTYINKSGVPVFTTKVNLGLKYQSVLLNNRKLHKAIHTTISNERTRHLLCNGTIEAVPMAYLGKFKDLNGLPETIEDVKIDFCEHLLYNLNKTP